jgi:hypothetical protein
MVQFAHGRIQSLTTDLLNTLYDVVTNFEPKAIRLYWVGLQSTATAANSQAVAERRGVGFIANNGGVLTRSCVGTFSADNSGNADCGSIWSNTSCVITVSGAGAKDGAIDIDSVDALGFTLILDDVLPANITVFYEAWGGDEITNITIGAIAEPAAIGNQTYTATGFTPSTSGFTPDRCIMLAGVQTVNATDVGQAQDSGLHVGFVGSGFSTALPDQFTVCGNSDDGSATMDTDGYNQSGQCLSMITIAGGNPNAIAGIVSYGTDTFTLDWSLRATTNRRSIYMAIKGGQWRAGSLLINGNTLSSTATISGLPFNVKGISLLGAMKPESTANTSTAQDRIGFGSGTSTTVRNSAAVLDENGTANSEINLSLYTTQVLVYPSTAGGLQTAYDINAIGANQVQLITDTAGGVALEQIGYLVFGDKKVTAGTIGHPFIF